MIKFIYYWFARFPYLEIAARLLYWKFTWANALLARFKNKKRPTSKKSEVIIATQTVSLAELEKSLRQDHGISAGSILIVHSSMRSLACTGATPSQIIDLLMNLVGPNGTLVMPAIPKYEEAITGVDHVTADLSNALWIYDVQKTPPWTGALPYKLMKTDAAIRSKYPLNTVVAKGACAQEMLERELLERNSTPCGPNSAWAYCASKNAKILAIGADLAHSLTMIHVAEDSYEKTWPVSGWYRPRKFLVRDKGKEEIVEIRERHPKWAMYYAERRLDYDLHRYHIAKRTHLNSIEISSLESKNLLDFLNARKNRGYPYYLWQLEPGG